MNDTPPLNLLLERSRERWMQHPFFSPETVVLGLDVGIEGIGICVRVGRTVIYCKTLMVNLPKSQALSKRRQLRAARHARKNYRTRMSRLRRLFQQHGLPWVSNDIYDRNDPYKLRYRALYGANPLASREALSLCIRSAVAHRGYDYFAMSREGDEYPWGESCVMADARKWLDSAFVDEEMRLYLQEMVDSLTRKNGDELSDEEREQWRDAVESAFAKQQERGLDSKLKTYVKGKCCERRMRGSHFPRAHIEKHLRAILKRHAHLVDDVEGFMAALFLPNDTRRHKKCSIFHFNRKTPAEAKRHMEKKVKPCPYCSALKLEQARCDVDGAVDIRVWKLVDFLSNRRFELKSGKLPLYKAPLPAAGIATMVEALRNGANRWSLVKAKMLGAMAPAKLATGEWNKFQLKHLKDICFPQKPHARSGMSAAAAHELFNRVTACGSCFEPTAMEREKKMMGLYDMRATISAEGGIYPQVRALLGTVRLKDGVQQFVTTGLLQSLFEKELADKLPQGKTQPDYVVIECVKGAPLNSKQKKELEDKQNQNRARRQKQAEALGLRELTRSAAYRLRLFEEQGGRLGKQATPAVCPFTGQELGTNPLSSDLELAHIYPDSRGGLYVSENLVLTTRAVNLAMGNRTPREAAQAGLPGWKSWEAMRADLSRFDWNETKMQLFCFTPSEEQPFPSFNNLTRTAQLAAELRNMAALWLGINSDAEKLRCRIGNPSGTYTAAARHSMLGADFCKDRSTTTHHRIDALVMSCIPPAEGINDVRYGGIFYTEKRLDHQGREQRRLTAMAELPLPDFEAVQKDASQCPIVQQRSHSKYASLGDSTFWAVDPDGKTRQRTPLVIDKETTVESLMQTFVDMRIPEKYRPGKSAVARWLASQTPATQDEIVSPKPLCLSGGVPIKSIHKYAGKGNLDKSPTGWSGIMTPGGKFDQLRKLDAANERLELWIGWNPKKSRWEYQTRVIPTLQVLLGIKRMGMPWRGRRNAPEYLLSLLESAGKPDLCSLVCGRLWPHSIHLKNIRKGDIFTCEFRAQKEDNSPGSLPISTWGEVSAVNSNRQIEIKALTHKDRKKCKKSDASTLADLLGLPTNAATCAQQLGLIPPA